MGRQSHVHHCYDPVGAQVERVVLMTMLLQEPGVWELLERIRQVVKPFGVQLLCEVHEDFHLNIELAR